MVPRLIKLTKAAGGNLGSMESDEIVINALKILMVEETHEKEVGNARIIMENGKSIYVEEDMDDIRDLANE